MKKHAFVYGTAAHVSNEVTSFWLCRAEEFYFRCHAEQIRLSNSRFGRIETPSYAPGLADQPGTQAKRDRARKELLEQHKGVGS